MPNHNGKTYIALGRDLGANESLDKNAFNRKFSYKCFQVVKLFYLNGIKVSLFTLEKFTDYLQLITSWEVYFFHYKSPCDFLVYFSAQLFCIQDKILDPSIGIL